MGGTETPLSREEVLGGFVSRRASTTLYAIERRTLLLALEARQATAPAICEDMIATQERALLSAVGGNHHLGVSPTAQQLERYVHGWRHLAPRDAEGRAGLARRIGHAHRFRHRDVPGIREVLALDDPAVRKSYRDRFGAGVEEIYAVTSPWHERLRWWWARVADRATGLPPFWTAFALTLTQTVGAGVLALPIALAGVGPLPGLVLLAALGLVNVLTVAAIAESFVRTGTVRWGGAFLGRVVARHLGPVAGVVLSLALALLGAIVLAAYYIGLATMVEAATRVPQAVSISVLFAVTLAAVARGRLEGTIASALVIGAINLSVIVALSLVALLHLRLDHLTATALPFTSGRAFDPNLLGLVFGVVLMSYFGHTAAASGARVVLRRDPTGRALVRGTAAAMLTVIALYALWTVAIGGAVPAARLAATSGTALEPLAEVVGSGVFIPGAVFVVLAMGMGAVVFSLGLHHQAGELLPTDGRTARIVGTLPLLAVFVTVQVLVATGRESFTGALSLVGVLTGPLLVGVVPILLLVAARRNGEYVPAVTVPLLHHRPVLVILELLFVGALLVHGTVIWTAPLQRAAAIATAAVAVAVIVSVLRSGVLRPTATVELRRDAELDRYRLRFTVAGRRGHADVEVTATSGGRADLTLDGATDLPPDATAVAVAVDGLADDGVAVLRVWMHEADTTGASRPLALPARWQDDDATTALAFRAGVARIPLDGRGGSVHVSLAAGRETADDGDVGNAGDAGGAR